MADLPPTPPSLELSVGQAAEATIEGTSETWLVSVDAATVGLEAACGGLRSFRSAVADEGFEIWAIDVSLINNATPASIARAPRLGLRMTTTDSAEVPIADPCQFPFSFGLPGTTTADRVVVAVPAGTQQLTLTWNTGQAAQWNGRSATWSIPRP